MDSWKDQLEQMLKNISAENTPTSSNTSPIASNDAPCVICGREAICKGMGVISYDVPVGHADFGKLFRCPNNPIAQDDERRERLRRLSNLTAFADKNFDNFKVSIPTLTAPQNQSLQVAYNNAYSFAHKPEGWLLLEGGYGCGKTHLAAAVGNVRLEHGEMVLFITTPDLLDYLRSTYGPTSEIGYDQTFDRIRDSQLLIIDDLGVENPSQWAQEKLFQLFNYRYSQRRPTVITTNIDVDRLDGRIRSRLLDDNIIRRVRITAPDYRTPTVNEHKQITDLAHYRTMTFGTFDTHTKLTGEERENLEYARDVAWRFANKPDHWVVFTGRYGCGKTHLAAAIANHRLEQGDEVLFVTMSDLMDYLRMTFNSNAGVSLDERLQAVRNATLLVIDDLNMEGASAWVRQKVFQILDHRYVTTLPTVITTAQALDDFDERLRTRLIDRRRCEIIGVIAPDFATRLNRGQR